MYPAQTSGDMDGGSPRTLYLLGSAALSGERAASQIARALSSSSGSEWRSQPVPPEHFLSPAAGRGFHRNVVAVVTPTSHDGAHLERECSRLGAIPVSYDRVLRMGGDPEALEGYLKAIQASVDGPSAADSLWGGGAPRAPRYAPASAPTLVRSGRVSGPPPSSASRRRRSGGDPSGAPEPLLSARPASATGPQGGPVPPAKGAASLGYGAGILLASGVLAKLVVSALRPA